MELTFTKLEKSLAEARMRVATLDKKHKLYIRLIKKIEAEIDAIEETIYCILNQLDILAKEHSLNI